MVLRCRSQQESKLDSAANAARLTGRDLFAGKFSEETYQANIDGSGLGEKGPRLKGYSQALLRALPFNSFDIVLIDRPPEKRQRYGGAVLTCRLLKEDGIMVLDDDRCHLLD